MSDPDKKKTRRQQVIENRQHLKQIGPYKYFIQPEIQKWKKNPIKNSFLLIFWILSTYLIVIISAALLHDMYYCTTPDINITKKYLEHRQYIIEEINSNKPYLRQYHTTEQLVKINGEYVLQPPKTLDTTCTLNIIKWWQQPKHTLKYIKMAHNIN